METPERHDGRPWNALISDRAKFKAVRARRLRQLGMEIREIAKALECAERTIYRYLRGASEEVGDEVG